MISSVSRIAARRVAPATRTYATGLTSDAAVAARHGGDLSNPLIKEQLAVRHHAEGSANLWKRVTYFVAIPLIGLGYLNAEHREAEHHAHEEHLKEENDGEAPEKVIYPYMNKRDKPFPWGNQSLFFNPHVNVPAPDL